MPDDPQSVPENATKNDEFGKGIPIRNTTYDTRVDLNGRIVPCSVVFEGIVFNEEVILDNACIQGNLTFSNCRFEKGLNMNHCKIEGCLTFESDCEIECIDGRGLKVDLFTNLYSCIVSRHIDFYGSHFGNEIKLLKLQVKGEDSRDAVSLDSCLIDGPLKIFECQFGGDRSVHLADSLAKDEIRFEHCDFSGQLSMDRTKINSQFTILNTKIGYNTKQTINATSISLSESRIDRSFMIEGTELEAAIHLDGTSINGDMKIEPGLESQQRKHIIGATQFSGFQEKKSNAVCSIRGVALTVRASIEITDYHCAGNVDLEDATIDGEVRIRNSHLGGPFHEPIDVGLIVLNLSGAKVDRRIDISGSHLRGRLNFRYLYLNASLHLHHCIIGNGGQSEKDSESGLQCWLGTINGDFELVATQLEGGLSMAGAEIRGDCRIDFGVEGESVKSQDNEQLKPLPFLGYLDFDGTSIGGSWYCFGRKDDPIRIKCRRWTSDKRLREQETQEDDADKRPFVSGSFARCKIEGETIFSYACFEGDLILDAASIGLDLTLSHLEFVSDQKDVESRNLLNLRQATIGGTLKFDHVNVETISLRRALVNRLNIINIRGTSGTAPPEIHLGLFRYNDLSIEEKNGLPYHRLEGFPVYTKIAALITGLGFFLLCVLILFPGIKDSALSSWQIIILSIIGLAPCYFFAWPVFNRSKEAKSNRFVRLLSLDERFSPENFRQMEKWLRERGSDLDELQANKVQLYMRVESWKNQIESFNARNRWLIPLGPLFWGWKGGVLQLLGYGLCARRVLLVWIWFQAITVILFWNSKSVSYTGEYIESRVAVAEISKDDPDPDPHDLPDFWKQSFSPLQKDWRLKGPIVLAIRLGIPLMAQTMWSNYRPSANPIPIWTPTLKNWKTVKDNHFLSYQMAATFLIAIDWILVSTFLVAASGIMVRRSSE